MTADFDSNKAKLLQNFDGIKYIIKYQTTNRVLGTNKAKLLQEFDSVLKSDMFQSLEYISHSYFLWSFFFFFFLFSYFWT